MCGEGQWQFLQKRIQALGGKTPKTDITIQIMPAQPPRRIYTQTDADEQNFFSDTFPNGIPAPFPLNPQPPKSSSDVPQESLIATNPPNGDWASTADAADGTANLADQPGTVATQMDETEPTGEINREDFAAALACALADELERRGLDLSIWDNISNGRSDVTAIWQDSASQADQEEQDDFREKFAQAVKDFTAAVQYFATQEHEININIDESGATPYGQITRY